MLPTTWPLTQSHAFSRSTSALHLLRPFPPLSSRFYFDIASTPHTSSLLAAIREITLYINGLQLDSPCYIKQQKYRSVLFEIFAFRLACRMQGNVALYCLPRKSFILLNQTTGTFLHIIVCIYVFRLSVATRGTFFILTLGSLCPESTSRPRDFLGDLCCNIIYSPSLDATTGTCRGIFCFAIFSNSIYHRNILAPPTPELLFSLDSIRSGSSRRLRPNDPFLGITMLTMPREFGYQTTERLFSIRLGHNRLHLVCCDRGNLSRHSYARDAPYIYMSNNRVALQ